MCGATQSILILAFTTILALASAVAYIAFCAIQENLHRSSGERESRSAESTPARTDKESKPASAEEETESDSSDYVLAEENRPLTGKEKRLRKKALKAEKAAADKGLIFGDDPATKASEAQAKADAKAEVDAKEKEFPGLPSGGDNLANTCNGERPKDVKDAQPAKEPADDESKKQESNKLESKDSKSAASQDVKGKKPYPRNVVLGPNGIPGYMGLRRTPNAKCTSCQKWGHKIEDCGQKIWYPVKDANGQAAVPDPRAVKEAAERAAKAKAAADKKLLSEAAKASKALEKEKALLQKSLQLKGNTLNKPLGGYTLSSDEMNEHMREKHVGELAFIGKIRNELEVLQTRYDCANSSEQADVLQAIEALTRKVDRAYEAHGIYCGWNPPPSGHNRFDVLTAENQPGERRVNDWLNDTKSSSWSEGFFAEDSEDHGEALPTTVEAANAVIKSWKENSNCAGYSKALQIWSLRRKVVISGARDKLAFRLHDAKDVDLRKVNESLAAFDDWHISQAPMLAPSLAKLNAEVDEASKRLTDDASAKTVMSDLRAALFATMRQYDLSYRGSVNNFSAALININGEKFSGKAKHLDWCLQETQPNPPSEHNSRYLYFLPRHTLRPTDVGSVPDDF